jgi:hypothetical protein
MLQLLVKLGHSLTCVKLSSKYCKLCCFLSINVSDKEVSFNFLGLCLNFNGKFNVTQKKRAYQGKKKYLF